MSNRVTRVAVTSTPGRGRHVILETGNTSVSTGPPVIMGITELQLLGAFSGTVSVDCPSQGSGEAQDLTFSIPLAPGLPNAFTLTAGSSGIITATCYLVTPPDPPNLVIGLPALSLVFGTGLPTQAGSGTWTLRPQIAYQGPSVNAVVRAYSGAGNADTTLTFVVSAILVGIPASS